MCMGEISHRSTLRLLCAWVRFPTEGTLRLLCAKVSFPSDTHPDAAVSKGEISQKHPEAAVCMVRFPTEPP